MIEDPAKLPIKKQFFTKDDACYFMKLIEIYKKKIPSQYSTITLQKVIIKDEENNSDKESYMHLETFLAPKSSYLPHRKLTSIDEIWNQMSYKNLSPEQKYKKYKKLLKLKNKKIIPNKYIKSTLTKSYNHGHNNHYTNKNKSNQKKKRKRNEISRKLQINGMIFI